jgi:hypothetical protein
VHEQDGRAAAGFLVVEFDAVRISIGHGDSFAG